MNDFVFSVLWTVLVSTATVLADWVAGKLVRLSRRMRAIRKAFDASIADDAKLAEIRTQIETLLRQEAAGLAWGSDLATIALALDVAALGLWTSHPEWFPFFAQWNPVAGNREAQVWLSLLTGHFVLLLLSLVFKHLHGDLVQHRPAEPPRILSRAWFARSRWVLASNTVGFLTLLSSFLVLMDAFRS